MPTKSSHDLLENAFSEAATQVQKIVSSHDAKDHGDILNGWIDFMESRALVVLLKVPNDADAYRMFETLNDRGLRTSQSDLVKNYLFGRSGDRLPEVQQKWAFMRGSLESVEDDDITITFLRHALTVMYGHVREADVYETVQKHARSVQPVVTFSNQIESLASTYVALFNPEHERWNEYSDSTRKALEVLALFGIKPMRPLTLATAQKMDRREAETSLEFFVSLSVRLMVIGGTRTGSTEEGLADAAYKVFNGEITTADQLKQALRGFPTSDEKFRSAFETATVSNRKLARYYLRSLEMAAKSEREPWHIPNDDRNIINLEHILPEKPENNWPQFTPDEVKLTYRRIGNMCLLRASDNSHIKSAGFTDKKRAFQGSPYALTSQIAESPDWTIEDINQRQKTLARFALQAWPI